MFIFLTGLSEKHALMIFSVEIVLLPMIYHIGYEVMMDKQKKGFERDIDRMKKVVRKFNSYSKELEEELFERK